MAVARPLSILCRKSLRSTVGPLALGALYVALSASHVSAQPKRSIETAAYASSRLAMIKGTCWQFYQLKEPLLTDSIAFGIADGTKRFGNKAFSKRSLETMAEIRAQVDEEGEREWCRIEHELMRRNDVGIFLD
jgi:hypothetical protein